MKKNNYETIARQLSCPEGEEGIGTGQQMQETNGHMIRETLKVLNANGKSVLELGYGNGAHVALLSKMYPNADYHGLEISTTMYQEARKLNTAGRQFDWYNGKEIPMDSGSLGVVFSVNTVYFWEDPIQLVQEIYRVLEATGVLVLAFRDKDFMASLPFVAYGFQLYTTEELCGLLTTAGFKIRDTYQGTEVSPSILHDMKTKNYCIIIAYK